MGLYTMFSFLVRTATRPCHTTRLPRFPMRTLVCLMSLLLAVSASQSRWGPFAGKTTDGRVLCCRSTDSVVRVEVGRYAGRGSNYLIENITQISALGNEVRIDFSELRTHIYKNPKEDSPDESTKVGEKKVWTFPFNIFTFPDADAAKEFAEPSQKLLAASPLKLGGETNDGRVLYCCRLSGGGVRVDVNRVDGPGSNYPIENIMKISAQAQCNEVRIDSARLEYVNVYKNGEKIRRDPRWTYPHNIYTFPDAHAAKEFAEASQKLVAASPFKGHLRDLELDGASIQHLSEDTIDLLLRTGSAWKEPVPSTDDQKMADEN